MASPPLRSALTRAWAPAFPEVAGFVLGLVWFLAHGGGHALVPTHIDWVAQNDWSQHYLGWAYFRSSPWSWPLGRTPGLAAPMGCNLAFSDSAPLVAVVLRPLLAWCTAPVQFIGPFLACAFGLQGAWAVRLARRLGGDTAAQLAFAALLVAFPPLLHRIDHDTLTSHWTLLASFALALGPAAGPLRPGRYVAAASGVVAFVAGTHPYLLAMVWPLLFGATALHASRRTLPRRACYAAFAALGPGVFGLLYALGYLDDVGDSGSNGYRFFAANLVAWINPEGWSRLLPTQPVFPGQQFEGFAYLGLGGLFLLAAGVLLRLRHAVASLGAGERALGAASAIEEGAAAELSRPDARAPGGHRDRATFLLLFAVTGSLALFAASDAGHLRLTQVWDLTTYTAPLSPLMRTFRSSGRFAWPLTYLVVVWAAACVLRRLPPRAATSVLALAAVLEVIDVRPLGVQARLQAPGLATLRDPRWALLGRDFEELTLVPLNVPNSLVRCGRVAYPNKYELALGFVAVRHGMRINSAYTARVDDDRVAELCVAQLNGLQQGRPFSPRHLYVVAPGFLPFFTRPGTGMRCGQLDGYHVCAAAGSGALAAALE